MMTPSLSDIGTRRARRLEWWEIRGLESRGCSSADWAGVTVGQDTDLSRISRVEFAGSVSIGRLHSPSEICDARITDCQLADDVTIRNVHGGLKGCDIRSGVTIENVARLEFEPEAPCGLGTEVCVLDETGSRPVRIYPGLSAQLAAMAARMPRWAAHTLFPMLSEQFATSEMPHLIGEGAVVRDCGAILNVYIGREVTIEGAASLRNGAVVNNAAPHRPLAYIGAGVIAENFIVEDGSVAGGAVLHNVYVGQGASLGNGFTAHDSLFFANCTMENGEACALFAGPYSVSVHKSTLLIGAMTSFLNAGSATNQSNHMYKLGPVHWGLMERGVKTSSDSYIMWGAKVGAFSLLMGQHKTHPDSSDFPFSYLFGDDKGATTVAPAMMLRSCGLLRDEKKWPTRDRRMKRKLPMRDRIIFDVLNPLTVGAMLRALDTISDLLSRPADDDRFVRYKGMKFRFAALERAQKLYTQAIYKYLSLRLDDGPLPSVMAGEEPEQWVDLAGQLLTRKALARVMEAGSVVEAEAELDRAFSGYRDDERMWIAATFGHDWLGDRAAMQSGAAEFDRGVEDDRASYRAALDAENAMLTL